MKKELKLKRIQELKSKLSDLEAKDPQGSIERLLSGEAQKLGKTITDSPYASSLRVLATGLSTVQKDPRVGQLTKNLSKAQKDNDSKIQELVASFSEKNESLLKQLRDVEASGKQLTQSEVKNVLGRFAESETETLSNIQSLSNKNALLEAEINKVAQELKQIYPQIPKIPDLSGELERLDKNTKKTAEEANTALQELEKKLNARISAIQGGGNQNRRITVAGDPSTLSRYTDINFKNSSSIGWITTINTVTEQTEIQASILVGGGGGSGITRSTSIITANTTGGATAATDYIYIATTGLSFTLPDATGNTNLYTLKNATSSSVLVTAIGGDTIDGSSSVLVAIDNQSLDFTSDGSNYRII